MKIVCIFTTIGKINLYVKKKPHPIPTPPILSYMHVSTPYRQWTVEMACWLISTFPHFLLPPPTPAILQPALHPSIYPSPISAKGNSSGDLPYGPGSLPAPCSSHMCVCVRVLGCPTCSSVTTDQTTPLQQAVQEKLVDRWIDKWSQTKKKTGEMRYIHVWHNVLKNISIEWWANAQASAKSNVNHMKMC